MVVGTVATTGAGTKIWLREWNGNWGSWTSISGPPPGFGSLNALALSSWGNGRLDVFVRAADNAVWHRFKTPSGWSSWFSLGGNATTKPAAASWGVGRIDVFVGSSDGNLYELSLADGTEQWKFKIGRNVTAAPAIGEGCLVIGAEGAGEFIYCFGAKPE